MVTANGVTMRNNANTLTLYIFPKQNGSFTLYQDEGLNYNHEKGRFSTIEINTMTPAKLHYR